MTQSFCLASSPLAARRILQMACLGIGLSLCLPGFASAVQDQAGGQPATRPAQDANQPGQASQPAQAGEVPEALLRLVDDFYHYATVGNYTAAQAYGEQLLAGNHDPEQVLDAFTEIQERRGATGKPLDQRLLEWQNAQEISAVATEITRLINEGRIARATNPEFVAEQLERLNGGALAYRNAIEQLRNSAEYAVPVMIRYLADPQKAQFHADIRRAMRDLGVDMLNPLWAATEMEDPQVLASILIVLGDLGYDASVPYLKEQAETSENDSVRRAAQQALARLSHDPAADAATEYRALAEKFYYGQAPVVPNKRLGTATIWSWGGQHVGLVRTDVPPQIFNEIMSMRAAGNALELGQGQNEALALWLAGNYRREGELGEGEEDRTQPEGSPSAHYYGAQAGTSYLQDVLSRAERDRRDLARGSRYNTADVSLRAIKSLQEIIGRGNIGAGETPLTVAMNYPDRRVRIEAAFALAQALPTETIAGQEQVVPLLADALSQTGQPSVLVLTGDQETRNRSVEQLQADGYRAVGAGTVVDAISQAGQLPSVDVLVIDARLGDGEVDTLLSNAQRNPKLTGSAKLMLVGSEASRYELMKESDPTLETATTFEGPALTQAVERARTSVGGLGLDPQGATELALRSGNLLKQIGTGASIFRLESAEPLLLAALDDTRPEVRMLAGEVVALLDSQQSQQALLDAALKEDSAPDVRISLLNSLATSAKRFGARLQGPQVDSLLATAANRDDLNVQAAAAEAVGALNLPADQARRLIIEQTEGTSVAQPAAGTAGSASPRP